MAENVGLELNQYLTFTLDEEQYAVSVARVVEVLEYTAITKVPRTSEFMRGVINVRGSVIPVVDLRLKFGMSETERSIDTAIIVMQVEIGSETVTLGTLADSVQEVVSLDDGQIEPPPQIGTKIDTKFIRGIGTQNDRFVIILEIDKVFTDEEFLASAAGDTPH
jgi:purine-binding chemotaxis protein CheW